MRIVLALIAVSVISGCARSNYAEAWPDRFTLSGGPQPGYAIKRVVEKQSPISLLGDDGSVCRTSAQRFAATKVGVWIACNWTLPSVDSTQIARGDGLAAELAASSF